ncbi:amino acid ABC transporter ATP-binding protein [Bradyrhizobium ontarionense]|uniref:Amino acid ABC transporter ATP-binding protein n=1 Tax=Bradyrhizobium ontarionense TaxID=2898149 RepID=A0ABY3R5Z4_9BRAD|nr:amino acid ABC transporter ATP-binding protein [Bradyrhizobium sp. A19]UFZ02746.1 amino acid ABC transporter ATP-binding protein [Bradyrhizobium sp. A19]
MSASDQAECAVSIRGLQKRFGTVDVLQTIDLDVAPGEVVVLVGPSGSGKTTLLRSINLLERPSAGRVTVGGDTLSFAPGVHTTRAETLLTRRIRLKTAMVFQAFNLFPHMTALANVAEGLISVKRLDRESAHAEALGLLERMGLGSKANAYPATLSGGQKQRVAIARALAMRPQVMLFDEPTSALDPELRREVLSVLRDIAAGGMTMVVVTHEMAFAREIADKIVFMENGRIRLSGSPDAFFGSKDPRILQFLTAILA